MLSDFRLKVFLAVATEKSFSRAAYSLGISQPAVSQKISSLEAELGTPLFSRAHGDISLTEKGRILLPYAKRIVSIDEAAVAALSPGTPAAGAEANVDAGAQTGATSDTEVPASSQLDALPLIKELFRYIENLEGKEYLRDTIKQTLEGLQ